MEKGSYLRSGYDLPAPPLALRSAFNNARQIKNLDLSSSIFKHSRDCRERGERVRSNFTLGFGNFGKECRFAHGGKAHKCYAGIATFANIEASSST